MVLLVMFGKSLEELGFLEEQIFDYVVVKEVVLLFVKFFGIDIILGFEMCLIGEVMGIDIDFGKVFVKVQLFAG